jgi:hypothetical protein
MPEFKRKVKTMILKEREDNQDNDSKVNKRS